MIEVPEPLTKSTSTDLSYERFQAHRQSLYYMCKYSQHLVSSGRILDMTKNNSRQTTLISVNTRKTPTPNGLPLPTAHTVIVTGILLSSILLTIYFAIIAIPGTAIAQPKTETVDTTIQLPQTGKLDKTTIQDTGKDAADAPYAGPKAPKKNSEQNSATGNTFKDSAVNDLRGLQKDSGNGNAVEDKDSTAKKTTVTSEVLLNLDYDDPGDQKKGSSFFGSLVSGITSVIGYILSIAFVLALGIFAIYGVKFFSTKYGTFTGAGNDLLNVLEVKHIAPGKAVCLVEIAGKVLILSMAGNTINHLSDITEQEKVEALKLAAEEKKTEPLQPFQIMLEKISNRYTNKKTKRGTGGRPQAGETRIKRMDNTSEWQDDLHTTGDNIRKLLEEIAERDKPVKRTQSTAKRDRGGEHK
jgi:flagellar biogenesis protein FliO